MTDLPAAAVRFVTIAGIALLVGAVCFHAVVLRALRNGPPALREHTAHVSEQLWRVSAWTAAALVVALVLRLALQVHTFLGDAGWVATAKAIVGATVWGKGWTAQAVVLAALVPLLLYRRRLAALPALALAVTPAFSGHAVSDPAHPALAVVSDSVHVLAGGAWIGGLALLVALGLPTLVALPPESRGDAADRMVRAFSPVALLCAAAIALTGVIAAWLHLEAWSDLWRSQYGVLLSVKIALFLLIAAAGAYNWRRATPRLASGGPAGVARLTRSAATELAIAVLLFAVTAVLSGSPLPDMHAAGPASLAIGANA